MIPDHKKTVEFEKIKHIPLQFLFCFTSILAFYSVRCASMCLAFVNAHYILL